MENNQSQLIFNTWANGQISTKQMIDRSINHRTMYKRVQVSGILCLPTSMFWLLPYFIGNAPIQSLYIGIGIIFTVPLLCLLMFVGLFIHASNMTKIILAEKTTPIYITPKKRIKERTGYVYLIENEKGLIKIGYTSQPRHRMVSLLSSTAYGLKYIHLIKTDTPMQLEKSLHFRFKEKRLRGEWFRLNKDDIQSIKQEFPLADASFPLRP